MEMWERAARKEYAQQIIDGNPIEVCQRDKVAMIDFLKIFFFITAKG